jgi:hypothetical protein
MFFYIETILRDPDHQRSIKIAVEGKTHIIVHNFQIWYNCLSVWYLILFLGVGNIPEEPWSI